MNKSKKMLKKTSEKTYNKNKKTLTEPLAYKKEKNPSFRRLTSKKRDLYKTCIKNT